MIITVGREFGSGGRELGKRLADVLDLSYYDREIVTEIAKRTRLDEDYVLELLDKNIVRNIPIHFGHTLSYAPPVSTPATTVFIEQNKILKEIAEKGNCIIVGRAAGAVLSDYKPFRLFVHADISSRIKRCQARAENGERISDKEMEKLIKRIDAERRRYFEFYSDIPWADLRNYDLCINTTDKEIKSLVPYVAEYIKFWYV